MHSANHLESHHVLGSGHIYSHEEIIDMIDREQDPERKSLLQSSYGWLVDEHRKDMDLESLLVYLTGKQARERGGQACPGMMLLFVSYVVMVLLHADIPNTSALNREFRTMMEGSTFEGIEYTSGHKDLFDISEAGEIYDFLKEAFLPIFLPEDAMKILINDGPGEMNRVLRYSRLIGGVSLRQQRRKSRDCAEMHPGRISAQDVSQGTECFASFQVEDFDDDCFGPLAFGTRNPGDRSSLPDGFCGDDTFEGTAFVERYVGEHDASSADRRLGRYRANILNIGNNSIDIGRNGNGILQSSGAFPTFPRPNTEALLPASPISMRRSARRLRKSGRSRSKPQAQSGINYIPGLKMKGVPRYSVIFSSVRGLPAAFERLQWLRENVWIDAHTHWIGANAFVLNPDMGVYLAVTCHFYFGLGGEVFPVVQCITLLAEPYQFKSILAADAAFVAMLMVTTFQVFAVLVHEACAGNFFEKMRDPWQWFDIVAVLSGILIVLGWATTYLLMFMVKDAALKEAEWSRENQITPVNMPRAMDRDDPEFTKLSIDLHSSVQDLVLFVEIYWGAICVYTMVLIVGFFKTFKAQPRLAMLLESLRVSLDEVVHHLIVCFLFWLSFSVASVLLFGRRVFEFSTLSVAMMNNLVMAFGAFRYDELIAGFHDNLLIVNVWFGAFIFIITLVLVNMFTAIVMDVYGIVKARALSSDTLWSQVWDTVWMYRTTREWIGTAVLLEVAKQLKHEHRVERVDSKSLQELIPGMPEAQATRIMRMVRMLIDADAEHMMTLSQTTATIGHIAHDVKTLEERMEHLDEDMSGYTIEDIEAALMHSYGITIWKKLKPLEFAPDDRVQAALRDRLGRCAEKIDRVEKFAGECVIWATQRSAQANENIVRIEDFLRNRIPSSQPPLSVIPAWGSRGALVGRHDGADVPRMPQKLGLPRVRCAYSKGQAIEYFSVSEQKWIPAVVISVLPDGRVEIDLKPGVWIAATDFSSVIRQR